MKIGIHKGEACKVKITVQVGREAVDQRFAEVLADFQKSVSLPGFRSGKAPADMVEKKFSKEIHEEVLKSLVPEVYHQAVAEKKLSPVSLPTVSDIEMERGKSLSFTAEFEQTPEVPLKNYKGIALKKEPEEVSADDLEKGMQSLLESKAELAPVLEPRGVKQGDFVMTDIEIWQNGEYKPGKKGILLYVEPNDADDFYEKIVGAQIDEVREISQAMSPEEKAQGLVGWKPHYKIWIRGIQEKKLPALDETLAKSFGKASVDELREAVRQDLVAYKQSESKGKMKNELFQKLIEATDFTLPVSLIEKQKEKLVDQARKQYMKAGVGEPKFLAEKDTIEKEASVRARDQVKLYFILQTVAEREGIEADENELERRLTSLSDQSKRPIEEVRRVFEDDLRESLREEKTIEFLLDNAKLEAETKH